MFNLKPENLVGDTNKLLFLIVTELQQLNDNVQSLRPIAKDTVVQSVVESVKPIVKRRPTVNKKGNTRIKPHKHITQSVELYKSEL